MKRAYKFYFIFLGAILVVFLVLIITNNANRKDIKKVQEATPTIQINNATDKPTAKKTYTSNSSTTKIKFTNKYGTATTICNHSGCTNTIATSGDTNCCTVHSNKCAECGCYIDEDALFCIDCLLEAIDKIKSEN
jgi:uncharacterized membrane protein